MVNKLNTKKTKHRSEDNLKKLTNRLNRIEGQIRGVKKMVEEEAYCTDILIQVSAIQSALKSFSREILNTHIKTCVVSGIKNGNEDEIIEELLNTLKKM